METVEQLGLVKDYHQVSGFIRPIYHFTQLNFDKSVESIPMYSQNCDQWASMGEIKNGLYIQVRLGVMILVMVML
jgi:hypothetical protein